LTGQVAAETRAVAGEKLVDVTVTVFSQAPQRRELAHREKGGLEVALYWEPATGRLTVCVCDHREGVYLEIPADREMALDVYYHPFAYRDQSTLDYEDDRLRLADTRLAPKHERLAARRDLIQD
jgi:hypothetical protein